MIDCVYLGHMRLAISAQDRQNTCLHGFYEKKKRIFYVQFFVYTSDVLYIQIQKDAIEAMGKLTCLSLTPDDFWHSLGI